MEAELSTVLVEGQAEDGGGTTPQGLAAVGITLVLLQQLEELQEHQPVPETHHAKLLHVGLLGGKPAGHVSHATESESVVLTENM